MTRKDIIGLVKRATGMVVQTGPFAGMRMSDVQTWGDGEDIGPQLLGVYEQELHATLAKFLVMRPTTVINIGCAEGYYAVGLARRLPHSRVCAFDIDPKAQEACRANAVLNGVAAQVEVEGACSVEHLTALAERDTNMLAIVDCEGDEKPLLSAQASLAALRHANIVVETHDYLDRDILPTLMRSLTPSHRLSIRHSGPRNPHAFAFLDQCNDVDKWLLVCENRPELQSWLVCERR